MNDYKVTLDLTRFSESSKREIVTSLIDSVFDIGNSDESKDAAVLSILKDGEQSIYFLGHKPSLFVMTSKAHRKAIESCAENGSHKTMLTLLTVINLIRCALEGDKKDTEYTSELQDIAEKANVLLNTIRKNSKEKEEQ